VVIKVDSAVVLAIRIIKEDILKDKVVGMVQEVIHHLVNNHMVLINMHKVVIMLLILVISCQMLNIHKD
jgi:hypothetical protein